MPSGLLVINARSPELIVQKKKKKKTSDKEDGATGNGKRLKGLEETENIILKKIMIKEVKMIPKITLASLDFLLI